MVASVVSNMLVQKWLSHQLRSCSLLRSAPRIFSPESAREHVSRAWQRRDSMHTRPPTGSGMYLFTNSNRSCRTSQSAVRLHRSRRYFRNVSVYSSSSLEPMVSDTLTLLLKHMYQSPEFHRHAITLFHDAIHARVLSPFGLETMISKSVTSKQARRLLAVALKANITPTSTTFAHVHKECLIEADDEGASDVLEQAAACGAPVPEKVVYDNMYPQQGMDALRLTKLHALLTVGRGDGLGAGVAAAWDLVGAWLTQQLASTKICNVMISKACYGGGQAQRLMNVMSKHNVEPDKLTWLHLLRAYEGEGDATAYNTVLASMPYEIRQTLRGMNKISPSFTGKPAENRRSKILDVWFEKGDEGYRHAWSLFHTLCDRQLVTQKLARNMIRNAHFHDNGHQKVFRVMMLAGIEPDSAAYSLLVARHRIEGDETAVREVLASMRRARIPSGGKEIVSMLAKSEDELMRMRRHFVYRRIRQGGQGRADCAEAVEQMLKFRRADDLIIGIMMTDAFERGDIEECRKLYTKGRDATCLRHLHPPYPGQVRIVFDGAPRVLALIAFAEHLEWIRSQLKKDATVLVGAWAYTGLEVVFPLTPGVGCHPNDENDMDQEGPDTTTKTLACAISIQGYLNTLSPQLQCTVSLNDPNQIRIHISGEALRAWASTSTEDLVDATQRLQTDVSFLLT
eukprot:m.54722 g.54722  ORF g.54722 m.54722 type:complete len:682 (-) comp15522_c0_seq3:74-2119(-)